MMNCLIQRFNFLRLISKMNFIKDDVRFLEGCGGKKAATAMNGGAKNERRREVQLLLWSAEGDNSDSVCA
jgi:hypothetical protein